MTPREVLSSLKLLDLHFETFHSAEPFARSTGHPVPVDTRGWSQILISNLTGVKGLERKKGADLDDGSDVKGANTWSAIDTPRFNGVIKAGTKALTANSIESLDGMPHLYFVLWDETVRKTARCRTWVVRTQKDKVFRGICQSWYQQRASGQIKSDNFQLHPPRGKDSNEIRNSCGNLLYPLLFAAERAAGAKYQLVHYDPKVLAKGLCQHSI
jgi:hypothetical protein